MNRPSLHNPGDPYYDPGYINRNPSLQNPGNFGNVNRGPYAMQNPGYGDGEYMGNDYNNVNDRSNKRLRVDGIYHGVYGGEGDAGFSSSKVPVVDSERRLRTIHDHGGPNSGFGFGGDRRGYALESSVLDRSVDGRDHGISSDFGMRRPSNVEMSSSVGMGHGVHYQGDGLDYQTGYGSRYGMVGNKFQNHDQQLAQHGQVAKPPEPTSFHSGGIGHDNDRQSHGYHQPNYGISHGSNETFYGSNREPVHSNNAPVHYDQRSNMPTSNHYSSSHPPFPSAMQQPGPLRYDYSSPRHFSDIRQPIETRPHSVEGYQVPGGNHIVPPRPHYGLPHMDHQGGYGNSFSENMGHLHASQRFDVQPPLPTSPPPPLPMEPPVCFPADHKHLSSPSRGSSSLFPVRVGSSAPVHSSHAPILESHARATSHLLNSQLGHMPRGAFQGDPQSTLTSFGQCLGDGQKFPSKNKFPDKPKTIDAAHLFKPPHRSSRPDHFVIIIRGLPGSGKSYLAKMLRDLEVEHGGNAPRIHSMDDYFMTEVEKVEDNDASKSSIRLKKPTVKKVLEYCYEPEMEEAYRSSMLKAFKKTLEEGAFTFVIGMVNNKPSKNC